MGAIGYLKCIGSLAKLAMFLHMIRTLRKENFHFFGSFVQSLYQAIYQTN